MLPEGDLLDRFRAVMRQGFLDIEEDLEFVEAFVAGMGGIPVAAAILTIVEAVVAVLLHAEVHPVLAPALVRVGGGSILRFFVAEHGLICEEVHCFPVQELAFDDIPAVFLVRRGREHVPLLVDGHEASYPDEVCWKPAGFVFDIADVPSGDIEDQEEAGEVGRPGALEPDGLANNGLTTTPEGASAGDVFVKCISQPEQWPEGEDGGQPPEER